MRSFLRVIGVALAVWSAHAVAEGASCAVPDKDKLTTQQQLECVKNATLVLPQPTLTAEQVTMGPDFVAGDDSKRFLYFTADDQPICFFKPHYAYSKVPGVSLKFRCWPMNAERGFLGRDGKPLAITGTTSVVLDTNKDGEKRGQLVDVQANGEQKKLKPDELKVKYLDPPFPGHNTRYNEVFTEVACTRFMWVLGFVADRAYSAGGAECVGCGARPFQDKQKNNTGKPADHGTVFKVVSVEREHPFDALKANGEEYWNWTDAANLYRNGWSQEQRVQFDAYRLALRLINYHNAVPQQNRVACAKWQNDDDHSGVCEQPMILVQDLGSTFGKPKTFLGENSRGRYKHWATQTVFKSGTCELLHPLDGDPKVFAAAQALLVERLAKLDRPTVEAIFKVARFDEMDQEQIKRLSDQHVPDVKAAALKEWTDTFMSRIAEIKSVTGCKP